MQNPLPTSWYLFTRVRSTWVSFLAIHKFDDSCYCLYHLVSFVQASICLKDANYVLAIFIFRVAQWCKFFESITNRIKKTSWLKISLIACFCNIFRISPGPPMILLGPRVFHNHLLNRLGIISMACFGSSIFVSPWRLKLAWQPEPLRMENQSDVFLAHALSNSIKARECWNSRVHRYGVPMVWPGVGFGTPFIFDIW